MFRVINILEKHPCTGVAHRKGRTSTVWYQFFSVVPKDAQDAPWFPPLFFSFDFTVTVDCLPDLSSLLRLLIANILALSGKKIQSYL